MVRVTGGSPGFCSPCPPPGSGCRSGAAPRSGASGRPGQWSRCCGSAAAPAGPPRTRRRPAGPGTCGQTPLRSLALMPPEAIGLAERPLPEGSVLCHETSSPDHTRPGRRAASRMACGLRDSGQVTTLWPHELISPMRGWDHISGSLSLGQRILSLNPTGPGIPGRETGGGEAAPETPPQPPMDKVPVKVTQSPRSLGLGRARPCVPVMGSLCGPGLGTEDFPRHPRPRHPREDPPGRPGPPSFAFADGTEPPTGPDHDGHVDAASHPGRPRVVWTVGLGPPLTAAPSWSRPGRSPSGRAAG